MTNRHVRPACVPADTHHLRIAPETARHTDHAARSCSPGRWLPHPGAPTGYRKPAACKPDQGSGRLPHTPAVWPGLQPFPGNETEYVGLHRLPGSHGADSSVPRLAAGRSWPGAEATPTVEAAALSDAALASRHPGADMTGATRWMAVLSMKWCHYPSGL